MASESVTDKENAKAAGTFVTYFRVAHVRLTDIRSFHQPRANGKK